MCDQLKTVLFMSIEYTRLKIDAKAHDKFVAAYQAASRVNPNIVSTLRWRDVKKNLNATF